MHFEELRKEMIKAMKDKDKFRKDINKKIYFIIF